MRGKLHMGDPGSGGASSNAVSYSSGPESSSCKAGTSSSSSPASSSFDISWHSALSIEGFVFNIFSTPSKFRCCDPGLDCFYHFKRTSDES